MMRKRKNVHGWQFMRGVSCSDSSDCFLGMVPGNAGGFKKQPHKAFHLYFLSLLLSVSIFMGARVAGAAEVKLTPKLAVQGAYDDNILFLRDDKVSSSVVTVSPGVQLDYQTLLSSLRMKADWDILSYLDESDLNRVNQYYRLTGDHRITERWNTSAGVNFYRDTTLNTYLDETGRVIERSQRDYLAAGGGLAYDFTPISTISGRYQYQKASHERGAYTDYDSHNASLYYAHRLKNQRDTLSVGPSYYKRSSDLNDVDSYSFDFGWARNWTSITSSSASIGGRYANVKNKRDGTEHDSVGVKANLNIISRGQVSITTFRYFHDIRTTVEGNDVNVDNFYLDYRRSITERFGIGVNGRLIFSYKLFTEQTALNDTRYYLIEPYISYRLTRDLDLSMRYRYQNHVEFTNADDLTKERNIVMLLISYAMTMQL